MFRISVLPIMPPGIEADGLPGMNFLSYFRFFIDQEESLLYLGNK